ncbi:MAG: autotransporter-associated beta strand repeat-containing protein, partial [Puniceicoccaceae bacterium]
GLDGAGTGFLRYTLDGATSSAGNNRIDNLQINAEGTGSTGPTPVLGTEATSGTAEFSGDITLDSSVELTAASGGTVEFSGIVADGANGAQGVEKIGAGTVALTGANTYTGGTTVTAGTLLANNSSGSATGTGNVTVNSGATLGGSGTIGGDVTVEDGGTLAPGNSIESLATNGDLTLNDGSTFAYEVDSSAAPGSVADLMVVDGDLNLDGTVELTIDDLASSETPFALGTTFSLINYSGEWNGGLFTFDSISLSDGDRFTAGLNLWEIDYNASAGGVNFTDDNISGSFVNLSAVPEPATFLPLAAGFGIVLIMLRRRRRA